MCTFDCRAFGGSSDAFQPKMMWVGWGLVFLLAMGVRVSAAALDLELYVMPFGATHASPVARALFFNDSLRADPDYAAMVPSNKIVVVTSLRALDGSLRAEDEAMLSGNPERLSAAFAAVSSKHDKSE